VHRGAQRGVTLLGIAGWQGSGKTTLIERLIPALRQAGLRVATIKRAHHALRASDKTTDGARHRAAGAVDVVVIGPQSWERSGVLQASPPPSLAAAAELLAGADLVLVEGMKGAPIPKIELRRSETRTQEPLAASDARVIAIAADYPIEDAALPVLALDDVPAIAEFIVTFLAQSRS
jgi:molybdopterin-guanine dinucleotide biosynthesis protein B